MSLDPHGVTSYVRSEELRSLYGRVNESVRMYEIVYTSDMVMYTHKSKYMHLVVFTALWSRIQL